MQLFKIKIHPFSFTLAEKMSRPLVSGMAKCRAIFEIDKQNRNFQLGIYTLTIDAQCRQF